MNNKRYQVVTMDGAKMYDFEQLLKKYEVIGFYEGEHLREELQNSPILKGLLGAMYGGIEEETGKTILRYETQEVYNRFY